MTKNEWVLFIFAAWELLILISASFWMIFYPKSFTRMFLSHLRHDFTRGTIYRQGQPPEHF